MPTSLAINGTEYAISDDLKRELSDALRAIVERRAFDYAHNPDSPEEAGFAAIDRSDRRAEALRDGMAAQMLLGALWDYDRTMAAVRWGYAVMTAGRPR